MKTALLPNKNCETQHPFIFIIVSTISIRVSISQTDGRIPGGTPADLQLRGEMLAKSNIALDENPSRLHINNVIVDTNLQ